MDIDFNKEYESNKYGKFKILEYVGLRNSHKRVKIKFINSGFENIVDLDIALRGEVVDRWYGYNPNKIFQSSTSGPFKMIEYLGIVNRHARVLVKFIDTGYEKDVQLRNALDGKVKDDTIKSRSRNFDINRFDNYDRYIEQKLISMHRTMINRCTVDSEVCYKYYGSLGIKICDEWLDRSYFLQDVKNVDRYECFYNKPFEYDLDKDYKQLRLPKSERIYSRETCIFLSHVDNLNVMYLDKGRNKYYGVWPNKAANFHVSITVHGISIYLGTYTDEIVAANVYNYWHEYYHNYELVPLFNNVPYVHPAEFIKYNVNPKELCRIVE